MNIVEPSVIILIAPWALSARSRVALIWHFTLRMVHAPIPFEVIV
jgi:hypothetical protein